MLEHPEEVEMGRAHFWLGVEGGSAIRMEGFELLDEFVVFGGSFDYVRGEIWFGRHLCG